MDGSGMRLVVKGSSITFWTGPNMATYQDATPIAAGHPGVGIVSADGKAAYKRMGIRLTMGSAGLRWCMWGAGPTRGGSLSTR
jgi:hypothetical protein